jgi:hypothetical protein
MLQRVSCCIFLVPLSWLHPPGGYRLAALPGERRGLVSGVRAGGTLGGTRNMWQMAQTCLSSNGPLSHVAGTTWVRLPA